MRRQRHVAGQPLGTAARGAVVPVRAGIPHQRREGMVDEALDRRDGAEARGERDVRHAVPRELRRHLPVDADVGPAKAVDRLLRVADDEELAGGGNHPAPVALGRVPSRQQQQDLGLERIGVLELVDEDARVALLRGGAHCIVAADQVSRPEQEVDEVKAPRFGLRPVVTRDRPSELLSELLLEQRREIGIRHLPEALEHGDDALVLLEDVRAGEAFPVLRAEPLARAPELAVRGQLDELRLDEVVVPLRPDGVGLPDRLRDSPRRLRVEEEAVLAAVGRPLRQAGEARQMLDHLVDGLLAAEVRLPAPGSLEVSPFRQLPGGAPQAPGRPVAARLRLAERGRAVAAPERAAHTGRRVAQRLLQPALELVPEEALRPAVVENLEPRVDPGLHRAFP